MSVGLRAVLIAAAALAAVYVTTRIRKSQMKIDDAIYWYFLTFIILVLAIFPGVAEHIVGHLGIESPANFVYLVVIFLLMMKVFSQSLVISQLERKIEVLTQKIAIKDNAHEEKKTYGDT